MIVITGATGNVGRPLVTTLADAGEEIVAVARRPAALPAGVRPFAADLTDPASLKAALEGASAVFLLLAGQALVPGRPGHGILEALTGSGVPRVVLLSSQGAGTRPESAAFAQMRALEDAIARSGLDWTVLRPGGFFSNALLWAEAVRSRREITAPFGDVGLPLVDPGDIAAVAAAVLRERGHGGQVYELTGPAPVSPREQAVAIGQALGEPVRFTEQDPARTRAELTRFMPAAVADGTLAIGGTPTAAEQRVSPDVRQILGRRGATFAGWARRNAEAFR